MAFVKINLAPLEELENPRWWLNDLAVFAFILVGGVFAVDYHLNLISDEIAVNENAVAEVSAKRNAIKSKLSEFKEKEKKVVALEEMYRSISKITESKLAKYLPVILVEHIQNLKPAGLWLESLEVGGKNQKAKTANSGDSSVSDKSILISGLAFDNILVAEFMTQLEATANGEIDGSDMRTQVFFRRANIKISKSDSQVIGDEPNQKANDPSSLIRSLVRFTLEVKYDEQYTKPPIDKTISMLMDGYRQTHLSRR